MENSEYTKLRTELESEYGDDLRLVRETLDGNNKDIEEKADYVFDVDIMENYGQFFRPITLPNQVDKNYELLGTRVQRINKDLFGKYTVRSLVYIKERD